MDAKLEKIIKKIEQLPTLPVISQKILELLSDEKVSYKEIVKIVENDPSILETTLFFTSTGMFFDIL